MGQGAIPRRMGDPQRMNAALIVLQVVAAALSAFVTLRKPPPRPIVTVTDAPGGISIAISCPVGYTLRYPGVTTLPTTEVERINDANRAVCHKTPRTAKTAAPKG